jgi:hypothetical protein
VIPRDEPNAELWQVTVVDCGGAGFKMRTGFRRNYGTVDIRATDEMGEALDEGEYLAALELPGFSERLSVPIVLQD